MVVLVDDGDRENKLLMVSVADLARYRFELDEHGALAAIEGVFPVCTRYSILEET